MGSLPVPSGAPAAISLCGPFKPDEAESWLTRSEAAARPLVTPSSLVLVDSTPAQACWPLARYLASRYSARYWEGANDRELAAMAVLLALRVPGVATDPAVWVTIGAALRRLAPELAAAFLQSAAAHAPDEESKLRAQTSFGALLCDLGLPREAWKVHEPLVRKHPRRLYLMRAAKRSARDAGEPAAVRAKLAALEAWADTPEDSESDALKDALRVCEEHAGTHASEVIRKILERAAGKHR